MNESLYRFGTWQEANRDSLGDKLVGFDFNGDFIINPYSNPEIYNFKNNCMDYYGSKNIVKFYFDMMEVWPYVLNQIEQFEADSLGLNLLRYKDLLHHPYDIFQIKNIVKTWGSDNVNKGYAEMYIINSDKLINGAYAIMKIDEVFAFEDDTAARKQAEKDGIKFINNVIGLEGHCYLDTPENRKYCVGIVKGTSRNILKNTFNKGRESLSSLIKKQILVNPPGY